MFSHINYKFAQTLERVDWSYVHALQERRMATKTVIDFAESGTL